MEVYFNLGYWCRYCVVGQSMGFLRYVIFLIFVKGMFYFFVRFNVYVRTWIQVLVEGGVGWGVGFQGWFFSRVGLVIFVDLGIFLGLVLGLSGLLKIVVFFGFRFCRRFLVFFGMIFCFCVVWGGGSIVEKFRGWRLFWRIKFGQFLGFISWFLVFSFLVVELGRSLGFRFLFLLFF